MKLRKILKSMWANYCNTFKDVPPGAMILIKKPASAGFFMSATTRREMKGGVFCYYGGL